MNSWILLLLILLYFGILFSLAYFIENKQPLWSQKSWVYALSLGVYCTAWTFYGSIGVAANSGLQFLTIYLGPVIAAPLWISILSKIFKICKQQKVSSLADFISLRYGGNKTLGALVTFVCLLAIVPYISLQLKAVTETFKLLSLDSSPISNEFWSDTTFYIALLLALFATFFGTIHLDTTEKRKGLVVSLAFESILKLLLFLIVGIWITFFLFDGTQDIFQQMQNKFPDFNQLYTFSSLSDGLNWMFMIVLSFMAIFLLPRQFHVSVVELNRQKWIKTAIWLFPLYLLLFNVLVIFIAWGGKLQFGSSQNADYFSILLPLQNQQNFLALLAFFGGFSAAISMVVISTLSLSIMLSNNVLIPYGFLKTLNHQSSRDNRKYIQRIRRISIFSIIIASYIFYVRFNVQSDLFSIGLIAFVIIAQLAPSFFAGLYWNRGSSRGASWGIVAGVVVLIFTVLLPAMEGVSSLNANLQTPIYQSSLFQLPFLDPIPNALYWSLLANGMVYAAVSLLYKGNYRERNYAELFVNNNYYGNLQEDAFIWKGEAYVEDIQKVLAKFLGEEKAARAIRLFNLKYNLPEDQNIADARLINFSEKLLTGSLGATSAKILISNVVQEEPIALVEVLKILDENKKTVEYNKTLQEQSQKLSELSEHLSQLNTELTTKDQQKDEFLDTIAHELKTPLTSIKASAEILNDEFDEMPNEIKDKFLNTLVVETQRINRLINQILEFEKLNQGKAHFNFQQNDIAKTIAHTFNVFKPILEEKKVSVTQSIPTESYTYYDEDKMQQVFTNLFSNALKFIPKYTGEIQIKVTQNTKDMEITFTDNGVGISPKDQDRVFEKFYQSENQNTRKPKGSGIGLAICKSIVEAHNGSIKVDTSYKKGAQFIIKIPKT